MAGQTDSGNGLSQDESMQRTGMKVWAEWRGFLRNSYPVQGMRRNRAGGTPLNEGVILK